MKKEKRKESIIEIKISKKEIDEMARKKYPCLKDYKLDNFYYDQYSFILPAKVELTYKKPLD